MLKKLEISTRFKLWQIKWEAVIYGSVALIAICNNKLLSAVFLFTSFVLTRYMNPSKTKETVFPTTFHADSHKDCVIISILSMAFAIPTTIHLTTSILGTVLVAFVLNYILYKIAMKNNRLKHLEKKYNEDFTKYGLSHEMASFAYDYKVAGLSIKEQMQKTGLAEKTVKNYRTKVNRAIEKGVLNEHTKENKDSRV